MKKGFTLIELLAVIVVLAILALVVTPIVLNIVENAQTGADERSLEGYAKVLQTSFYDAKMEDTSLTLASFILTADTSSGVSLTYSGNKVECPVEDRKVVPDENGSLQIELYNCIVNGRGYYKFSNGKADKIEKSNDNSIKTYSITTKLENIIIDNTSTSIIEGETYNAILTEKEGYIFDSRRNPLKITMGGKDITQEAYKDKKITIQNVIGNIEINVTAEKKSYSILKTLTNVTISPTTSTISHGESYSATITPINLSSLDSVTVKMGDVDITSTAYSNNNINIESVTGTIVIKANAISKFESDTWETIVSNVKNGNTSIYDIGNTKTIDLGSLGIHKIRLSNKSTPAECSASGFSQTACGFVLEFADIIIKQKMSSVSTNEGGWASSEVRTYINNEIYNSIPKELRDGIIDTIVVSGHGGKSDETNVTTTDKLYLLSTIEVWSNGVANDTAMDLTRQLDYYANLGVKTNNGTSAKKQYNGSFDKWWLRSANSITTSYFYGVKNIGGWYGETATNSNGVSPAFRIG